MSFGSSQTFIADFLATLLPELAKCCLGNAGFLGQKNDRQTVLPHSVEVMGANDILKKTGLIAAQLVAHHLCQL